MGFGSVRNAQLSSVQTKAVASAPYNLVMMVTEERYCSSEDLTDTGKMEMTVACTELEGQTRHCNNRSGLWGSGNQDGKRDVGNWLAPV